MTKFKPKFTRHYMYLNILLNVCLSTNRIQWHEVLSVDILIYFTLMLSYWDYHETSQVNQVILISQEKRYFRAVRQVEIYRFVAIFG